MAFRASRRALSALVKERNDVQPALRKTWKAYEPIEGLVTRHVSPYQVDILTGFFQGMPKKLKHRWIDHGPQVLISYGLLIGFPSLSAWNYHRMGKKHRDKLYREKLEGKY